jgi:Uma2 family endonuclease
MSALPKHHLTPQEYLAFERSSPEKHEYFDGEIFTMAGASRKHNIIAVNISTALRTQTRKRGCEVYAGDMRTRIFKGLYTYPDVIVMCGKPQFDDDEFDTLLNPRVIIEVLSPSTEQYDRTTKFDHYRSIESLQEYVLVSQDKARIEHFSSIQNDNVPIDRVLWAFEAATSLDASLYLSSADCTLTLADVYDDVEFDEEAPSVTIP